jgi:hypothetical protein
MWLRNWAGSSLCCVSADKRVCKFLVFFSCCSMHVSDFLCRCNYFCPARNKHSTSYCVLITSSCFQVAGPWRTADVRRVHVHLRVPCCGSCFPCLSSVPTRKHKTALFHKVVHGRFLPRPFSFIIHTHTHTHTCRRAV